MNFQIRGGNLPVVVMSMEPSEAVFTQSGGMAWMTDTFEMNTNMEGGLMGGFKRMFAGESLFMVTYTARVPGHIAFASSFPGAILPMKMDEVGPIICQKTAFLAGERSVNLEVIFRKKLSAGLFGGEGFILQRVNGSGMAFLEIDGDVVEYNLQPGQVILVDTGHVAAFEDTVEYEVQSVRGVKNVLFGGEGLFLTRMTGPGKVWLQTMPIANLAGRIIPYVPMRSD